MSFEDYVAAMIEADEEDQEPFCPFGSPWFGHGYCGAAYSDECYRCEWAKKAYAANFTDRDLPR